MGRQGPKGHPLPPSHAHLQGGGFIPRGVLMSDSCEASQGGFQQGGAAGADYSTTSVGDTGDPDSGDPDRILREADGSSAVVGVTIQ
jgi:hypothetical protein